MQEAERCPESKNCFLPQVHGVAGATSPNEVALPEAGPNLPTEVTLPIAIDAAACKQRVSINNNKGIHLAILVLENPRVWDTCCTQV